LGVKVDGGYSIKKGAEWKEKEDTNDEHTSIRKMYEDFAALQHNAFYELYSEEDWDYCNTHTLEQAIEEDYQPFTPF
jgi:hypothetical protein